MICTTTNYNQNYNLILASQSPRRKDILTNAGLTFKVIPADVDEDKIEKEYLDECMSKNIYSPDKLVERLSLAKAEKIATDLIKLSVTGNDTGLNSDKNFFITKVLAADTVVAIDGKILGKPKDRDDAYTMLSMLSGKAHQVYTGYTIIVIEELSCGTLKISSKISKSVCTDVIFYDLTEDDINWYLNTNEPFDKAGSYGIQGLGARFVQGIRGDYNNVVGLPLAEVLRNL